VVAIDIMVPRRATDCPCVRDQTLGDRKMQGCGEEGFQVADHPVADLEE